MIADRFLSIPFLAQGRSHAGCDCWGLVCLWYAEQLGIEIESFADTPANDIRAIARLAARYRRDWSRVSEPRTHDVVIMRASDRRTSMLDAHFGVVVDDNRVLHTVPTAGARIERLCSPNIAPRIADLRRHADAF